MLKSQKQAGRLYAAICAAPAVALAPHGLLDGKKATCYPSCADALPDRTQADQRVVVDGNCITSQGPGTALEFAIELVRQLAGDVKARQVAEADQLKGVRYQWHCHGHLTKPDTLKFPV